MPAPIEPHRVPIATYRLQLRGDGFGFDEAAGIVGYLDRLGIGDLYPSPLFRARSDSTHGYDVVDHGVVEPRFGGEEGLDRLSRVLRDHRMGLLLDLVPNHMGIDDPLNTWWRDLLSYGEGSRYASYFDIDWDPPIESMRHCVLMPILGDYFGAVLERQELQLRYERGRFWVTYYERRFPVAPATWPPILRLMLERCHWTADEPVRMELESLVTALEHLPAPSDRGPDQMRQRYRESEVAARRLRELVYASRSVHRLLDDTIEAYNGIAGRPRSFDRLEDLLETQPYRLAYWRVAGDEINYRRFFDINELAAIRIEEPRVFEAVHSLTFRLLAEGKATGLRIDHPDGLFDPAGYFEELQAGYREATAAGGGSANGGSRENAPGGLFVVVEKILAQDERIDPDWPVCGTTGYEFLNDVNALFVAPGGAEAIRAIYERFTGHHEPFRDILYASKRAILDFSMSSELHVLARKLARIAGQRRESHDFTYRALERALREVVAGFPVYRTYIRPGDDEVRDEDRRRVQLAIRLARRRNPELPKVIFDFLASVLLLEDPPDLTDEQRRERRWFVLKLQQVTGPVMAKGLEDTAFYRYYPLASLNEVGGEPDRNGMPPEELHRVLTHRANEEPFALLASGTHDMKRGEDVRARLNVLSEIPDEWEQALGRWRYLTAACQSELDGAAVPDPNEAYLIYQTIVGTWPGGTEPNDDYIQRIVTYCEKAFREAKLHTSWLDPDPEYEEAIFGFVRGILDPERSAEFLADLDIFVDRIAESGYLGGLAQALLKFTAPGVPDLYQGAEYWDFRLVDPDNRRPVDFPGLQERLDEIIADAESDAGPLAARLLENWPDERIKLYVTWRALRARKLHPQLFLRGDYLPIPVEGRRGENLFAFARRFQTSWLLVAVPRLTRHADRTDAGIICPGWWEDTRLDLPDGAPAQWQSVLTGRQCGTSDGARAEDLLADFPLGLWLGSK